MVLAPVREGNFGSITKEGNFGSIAREGVMGKAGAGAGACLDVHSTETELWRTGGHAFPQLVCYFLAVAHGAQVQELVARCGVWVFETFLTFGIVC
jgi:hypothetical protein